MKLDDTTIAQTIAHLCLHHEHWAVSFSACELLTNVLKVNDGLFNLSVMWKERKWHWIIVELPSLRHLQWNYSVFVFTRSQVGVMSEWTSVSERDHVCSVNPPWTNTDLKVEGNVESHWGNTVGGRRRWCFQPLIIFRLSSLMSVCATDWSEVNKVRPGTRLHRLDEVSPLESVCCCESGSD